MKRTVLFTLIISLASAPLALADGPILSSAKRQAQELVRTDATLLSLEANSSSAAVVQDGGMSGKSKVLMAVAIGVVAAIGMKIIDGKVYDNTPSTRRVREDGCSFFCGAGTNTIGK